MEFGLHTKSRYNLPSFSQHSSSSFVTKEVGLPNFNKEPSHHEAHHIVFKTRNLTAKFLTKTNEASSNVNVPSKDKSTANGTCLLSSHGLKRDGASTSAVILDRLEHTLNILPLTVCMKHGNASFLPLDYVRNLPEYTRITHNNPVFKVIHTFDDCVLEFPYPPPIGSSEDVLYRREYMNNCYQCCNTLPFGRTIFLYRNYVFCCESCRLKACTTHYWYKKAMEGDNGCFDISTMEEAVIFPLDL